MDFSSFYSRDHRTAWFVKVHAVAELAVCHPFADLREIAIDLLRILEVGVFPVAAKDAI